MKKRLEAFGDKIKECGLSINPGEVYSLDGAIDLLKKLTSDINYDGFRAYFAKYPCKPQPSNKSDSGCEYVPNDRNDSFTLIYVPTRPDSTYTDEDGKKFKRHKDDTTQCLVILNNSARILSARYASMWIRKAENQVLDTLQRYRQKKKPEFHETHSLWFNNRFVNEGAMFHNSLLDILLCRKCCAEKTEVHAKFATFFSSINKNHYQLSLLFQLGTGDFDFVSLYSQDMSVWAKARYKEEFKEDFTKTDGQSSGGSDTGKPCPPPTPCNAITSGSLLPNP